MPVSRSVGRPRASSRRDLEDAAAELFLEQGYGRTTIDDIARRAGVSRNTFFNYFASKGDLLWVDLDATVERLADALAAQAPGISPTAAVERALVSVAEQHPGSAVPIALTQAELMDTLAEFRLAGVARFERVSSMLRAELSRRGAPVDRSADVRAAAAAVTAACSAAVELWALAGPERDPLAAYVARAVAPVCDGFSRVLG
ncbi:TetR family transcriptional regulator [Agromyces intestinalis]|uniref:TetR family transcriptional regulator n=1 Tax=Agromyces intestinalis TaxID=2592652 RepID=A0A5C1YI89_9MICO|nr:TetR/AcrR family transcriptional regulator [Agromyces intestinalis]QEO15936.1 TetR family transcriptional regulator [Agromyces intestinalis]